MAQRNTSPFALWNYSLILLSMSRNPFLLPAKLFSYSSKYFFQSCYYIFAPNDFLLKLPTPITGEVP